jgi:hypothetical protein
MAAAAGALLGTLGADFGIAAQIDDITVMHRGSGYGITFDAVVDAPTQQVYAVLADYARLGKLSPVVTVIGVEASPTGRGSACAA